MKQLELTLKGHVQGVFLRQSCEETARRLGITGFARNNQDGTVTIVAQGEEPALKQFLQWLRSQSPGVKTAIDLHWTGVHNTFDQFEIRF